MLPQNGATRGPRLVMKVSPGPRATVVAGFLLSLTMQQQKYHLGLSKQNPSKLHQSSLLTDRGYNLILTLWGDVAVSEGVISEKGYKLPPWIFAPTKFKNATKRCYALGPYQAVIINSSTLDLHADPPLVEELMCFLTNVKVCDVRWYLLLCTFKIIYY
jgi:hypothetical protein